MTTVGRACLALLLMTGGCSLAVDVDDYEFREPGEVETPCGSAPTSACNETGERYVFVFASVAFGRVHEDGTADGLDLDGTDETVCGQPDYTSPFGITGVDNQFAPFVGPLEELEGMTFAAISEARIIQGIQLRIIDIGGVSDIENDPCVSYRVRDARVPAGVPLADLDRELPMGILDPGLMLDYSAAVQLDDTACIEDGLLHARLPSVSAPIILAEPDSEVVSQRNQVIARFETDADGAVVRLVGAQGGSSNAADVDRAFAAFTEVSMVTTIVQPDLDPDESGVCQSVSFSFTFDGVPAVLASPF